MKKQHIPSNCTPDYSFKAIMDFVYGKPYPIKFDHVLIEKDKNKVLEILRKNHNQKDN